MSDDSAKKRSIVRITAQRSAPLTFIQPQVSTSLQDVQAIAGTHLRMLRDRQADGECLTEGEAKGLAAITTALLQSEKGRRELNQSAVDELNDEELEAALEVELAAVKAKRLSK